MSINDIKNLDVSSLKAEPVKELAAVCRKIAAEGAVLIKNDNKILPFKKGEKISIFGRTQIDYNKSGTGSGGSVNVPYVTNITDPLIASGDVEINMELYNVYLDWIKENPFEKGDGWATQPWFQKEMPVSDLLAEKAAQVSEKAVVVIGRTAGEDQDNSAAEGSYYLTDDERALLKTVSNAFDKVCVLLNVGNVIDTSFIEEYNIDCVMYIWHGGMEGGNAVCDLLTGKVSPSGKLTDTVAYNLEDYPCSDNFGDEIENIYVEDIYVGYRYFETFYPEKVMYPFGYGLSYTSFEISNVKTVSDGTDITVTATVTNTGKYCGKEVVQCYYSAPQGKLGQPKYQLCGYAKTDELSPDCSQTVTVKFAISSMASFDDSGVTGFKNCFVLESGDYGIYVGNSVKNLTLTDKITLSDTVMVNRLSDAAAPIKSFNRIKPVSDGKGYTVSYEPTPLSDTDLEERIRLNKISELEYTGDCGFKLKDVADGKCTMEQFVSQLSVDDMRNIVKGEGMHSHKVTAGTAGAFGGVSNSLLDFGIPVVCVSDGPSGIRLDSGEMATSIPIGTLLASTFNDKLVEELHVYEGIELLAYKIDALLSPGMNIHRSVLNGRNFEYFSEDPLLTGKMAAAVCRGMRSVGAGTVLKHFACNNQETGRNTFEAVVSKRALREIYLKGYEIAIKEGNADAIMSSFNKINGYHCAGNYDLTTAILRNEWGFKGIVMTDWWARMNCKNEEASKNNLKQMVLAQNDLYMVCKSAESRADDINEGLDKNYITRRELQNCSINVLNYVLNSYTYKNYVKNGCQKPDFAMPDDSLMSEVAVYTDIENGIGYDFTVNQDGKYVFVYDYVINAPDIAQYVTNVMLDGTSIDMMTLGGTEGETVTIKQPITLKKGSYKLCVYSNSAFVMKRLTVKI